MNRANVQIIAGLRNFLEGAQKDKNNYCESAKNFSRQSKLGFIRVVLFIINLPKKSLSIELGNFFEHLGLSALCACTKSAFSQARQKLKSEFFVSWNREFLKLYYGNVDKQIKKWRGHTVLGLDGSTVSLFNDKGGKIAGHFGCMSGVVMGRVMNCIDVLNGICVAASLYPIGESEMAKTKEWIQAFKEQHKYLINPLLIFDRGFAGFALAWLLQDSGLAFVIRYSTSFNGMIIDFVASGAEDIIVDWVISRRALKELQELGYEVDGKTSIKVRLVRVELDTGEIEVLVTSLLDQVAYPIEEFKELYFLRWGTETQYDYWKNKMQIEIVSGHSVKAILQDFHATVFTGNVHSLLIEDCAPEVAVISENRINDYAVNVNVSLGFLKGRIVQLFLLPQPEQIITEIKALFIKHLEPIRPGRKNERNFKAQNVNGKYKTMTNYRQAI